MDYYEYFINSFKLATMDLGHADFIYQINRKQDNKKNVNACYVPNQLKLNWQKLMQAHDNM